MALPERKGEGRRLCSGGAAVIGQLRILQGKVPESRGNLEHARSGLKHAFYNSGWRGVMGGWGTKSFENDDAQDFLSKLKTLSVDDLRQKLRCRRSTGLSRSSGEQRCGGCGGSCGGDGRRQGIGTSTAADSRLDSSEQPRGIRGIGRSCPQGGGQGSNQLGTKDLWMEAEGLNEWSAELRDLTQRLAN